MYLVSDIQLQDNGAGQVLKMIQTGRRGPQIVYDGLPVVE